MNQCTSIDVCVALILRILRVTKIAHFHSGKHFIVLYH